MSNSRTEEDRVRHVEDLYSGLRFEFDALKIQVEKHLKDAAMNTSMLTHMEASLETNSKHTEEMYEIFASAIMGLKVIGWIGRQVMRFIGFLGKIAKPLFYIAAFSAALYSYLHGKGWEIPAWFKTLGL